MQKESKDLIITALISFFLGLVVAFASVLISMAMMRPCHQMGQFPARMEMRVQEQVPFNQKPMMMEQRQPRPEGNLPMAMEREMPRGGELPPALGNNPMKDMPKDGMIPPMDKKVAPKDKMKK